MTAQYSLYILLCDHDILYTGIAINPEERLKQHQQGHPFGAKFTRRFKHLKIIYQVQVGDRSQAQSLEIKLKRLTKRAKLSVIEQQCNLSQLTTLLK
ncbi:MAG: GIY-YIG nuclease family protein [Marinicella sp.]